MGRDFHAYGSLTKAGTDVTELKFGFGKVYLSPVIDFYNDEVLSYSLSESPNMRMVMDMPDGLYRGHGDLSRLMLHSDQSWQYQMPEYQRSLKEHGIIQSMSRKGDCLDNAKTENFFPKLKKEMCYGHEKDFRSFAEVRKAIDEYMEWYNTERVVNRLGGEITLFKVQH